jgi:hypothetical protein
VGKLYVFGDSYSTPGFCVEPRDSWWGLLANDLARNIAGTDNYSWPGNNIDSIQHIIVANRDMFRSDDYVVIGIPPIERLTVFEHDAQPYHVTTFDALLSEVRRSIVPRHNGLKQLTRHQVGRGLVELWNRSWQEAQILRQLITLSAWLDTVVKNYLIVNLSEPFQPLTQWGTLSNLQQQVLDHPKMIVFADTYYSYNHNVVKPVDFDTHGWFGHHGVEGNRRWYKNVLEIRMKMLGWL